MRKFLVVLDDSDEVLSAIRFAALRAAATGGAVEVLAVISADEIAHGIGVADLMRAEACDRITAQFEIYARWMRDRLEIQPQLTIREGDPATELLALIADDPDIAVIVLAAAAGSGGPGPLISRLMRDPAALPCPMTIVPGGLSRERLEEIA